MVLPFLAFPLFGVVVLPLLCFTPGPRHANDFGDAPQPSGVLKIASGFLSAIVALLMTLIVAKLFANYRP